MRLESPLPISSLAAPHMARKEKYQLDLPQQVKISKLYNYGNATSRRPISEQYPEPMLKSRVWRDPGCGSKVLNGRFSALLFLVLLLPALGWGQSITTIAEHDVSDSILYKLRSPKGMAFDQMGVAYIADTANHLILKIIPSVKYLSSLEMAHLALLATAVPPATPG